MCAEVVSFYLILRNLQKSNSTQMTLNLPKTPFIGVLISWETVAKNYKDREFQIQNFHKSIKNNAYKIRNKKAIAWKMQM